MDQSSSIEAGVVDGAVVAVYDQPNGYVPESDANFAQFANDGKSGSSTNRSRYRPGAIWTIGGPLGAGMIFACGLVKSKSIRTPSRYGRSVTTPPAMTGAAKLLFVSSEMPGGSISPFPAHQAE
jgi:hypothetical protein